MEQLQVEGAKQNKTKQNEHFEQMQLTTGMIQQEEESLQHTQSTEGTQELSFLFFLIENKKTQYFPFLCVFNVAKPFKPQQK